MTHTEIRVSGSSIRGRGTFRARGITWGLALLVAAATGAARAQDVDSPEAAAKQFEKGVTQELAVLKAAIKLAEKEAVKELDDFEHTLKGGVLISPSNAAATVADVIEDYQTAVGAALYEVYGAAIWLAQSLLSDLDDLDLLDEGYPETFHPGTHGAADRLRETSAKLAAKSADRLRKRLDHMAVVLHKTQSLCVAIRLNATTPGLAYTANPNILIIGEDVPLTVDFAVAVSTDSQTADARMIVGGQADEDSGDVEFLVYGADSSTGDDATPDSDTLRWRVTLDDGDDLFAEQNAVVRAFQGTGAKVTMSIGMP